MDILSCFLQKMKFKLLLMLMFHLVCFVSNVIAFELPQALRPLQSSMETSSATSAHSRKARFLGVMSHSHALRGIIRGRLGHLSNKICFF